MSAALAFLLLAAAAHDVSALRDVPKGYCHDCEVTCFEDCVLKFDREIIQPDVSGKDRLSRKDTAVEAHMKKKMYGEVLMQNATTALRDTYSACIKQDRCPCFHSDKKSEKKAASFLDKKKKCAISERPCALGCVNKTLDKPVALVQTAGKVAPGLRDPENSAIPWSINIHPVKINTFATGRQNLERCFKSCLAATCGCDDAPGMEAIEDLGNAIKANDAVKDPVEDTPPNFQYKKAAIQDCGKGMHGKKITKGLFGEVVGGPFGYKEVCSDEFFEALGTPGDIGKKNCDNSQALLAGCLWDDTKQACVYGLKKMIHCYTRYTDDDKL